MSSCSREGLRSRRRQINAGDVDDGSDGKEDDCDDCNDGSMDRG